jgi:hypothetical protein
MNIINAQFTLKTIFIIYECLLWNHNLSLPMKRVLSTPSTTHSDANRCPQNGDGAKCVITTRVDHYQSEHHPAQLSTIALIIRVWDIEVVDVTPRTGVHLGNSRHSLAAINFTNNFKGSVKQTTSLVLTTNVNSCPSSNHLEARFSSIARLEVMIDSHYSLAYYQAFVRCVIDNNHQSISTVACDVRWSNAMMEQ